MSPQQLAGAAASAADDLYGFGAMLYELLSGYPPSYGDGKLAEDNRQKHRGIASNGAGGRSRDLSRRLLADSPADRPADMASVERELAAVLAAPPVASVERVNRVTAPIHRSDSRSSRRIRAPRAGRAAARRVAALGAAARGSEDELRRQGFRRGLGAAALGARASLPSAVVFFVLPRWCRAGETSALRARRFVRAGEANGAEPEKKEVDFAALARAKQDADDKRAPLEERLKKLGARAADQWGGEEFRRANDELAAGDKEYEAREYITALEHFTAHRAAGRPRWRSAPAKYWLRSSKAARQRCRKDAPQTPRLHSCSR